MTSAGTQTSIYYVHSNHHRRKKRYADRFQTQSPFVAKLIGSFDTNRHVPHGTRMPNAANTPSCGFLPQIDLGRLMPRVPARCKNGSDRLSPNICSGDVFKYAYNNNVYYMAETVMLFPGNAASRGLINRGLLVPQSGHSSMPTQLCDGISTWPNNIR